MSTLLSNLNLGILSRGDIREESAAFCFLFGILREQRGTWSTLLSCFQCSWGDIGCCCSFEACLELVRWYTINPVCFVSVPKSVMRSRGVKRIEGRYVGPKSSTIGYTVRG